MPKTLLLGLLNGLNTLLNTTVQVFKHRSNAIRFKPNVTPIFTPFRSNPLFIGTYDEKCCPNLAFSPILRQNPTRKPTFPRFIAVQMEFRSTKTIFFMLKVSQQLSHQLTHLVFPNTLSVTPTVTPTVTPAPFFTVQTSVQCHHPNTAKTPLKIFQITLIFRLHCHCFTLFFHYLCTILIGYSTSQNFAQFFQ